MIAEIIKAGLLGAIPVAAFTFLILQWSIASGRMKPFNSEKSLRKQYKDFAKAQKTTKQQSKSQQAKTSLFSRRKGGDIFHGKIMSFGGGFYGTMAVATYLLIETIEIWQFLEKIFGPDRWFTNISFGLFINFLINSITNFIAAIVWFMTLPKYLPVENGWIWLVAAYLGYIAGLKLTTQHGDTIWAQLAANIKLCKAHLGAAFVKVANKNRVHRVSDSANIVDAADIPDDATNTLKAKNKD